MRQLYMTKLSGIFYLDWPEKSQRPEFNAPDAIAVLHFKRHRPDAVFDHLYRLVVGVDPHVFLTDNHVDCQGRQKPQHQVGLADPAARHDHVEHPTFNVV